MILYRINRYYNKHGLLKTISFFTEKAVSLFIIEKFILYSTDINVINNINLPNGFSVHKLTTIDNNCSFFKRLCEYFGEKRYLFSANKNFKKNATLWTLIKDSDVLGQIWSIKGNTVSNHFFMLCQNDVHLFSNEILEQYRGHGYNTLLINFVLMELKKQDISRVHIETSTKNIPEQKSLRKTPFRPYATASKFKIINCKLSRWYE